MSASGYQFDHWSGDLSGTANPVTITIDCNKLITTNFAQVMHSLTLQVNGSGYITPAVGDHDYGEGATVSVSAIPDKG